VSVTVHVTPIVATDRALTQTHATGASVDVDSRGALTVYGPGDAVVAGYAPGVWRDYAVAPDETTAVADRG